MGHPTLILAFLALTSTLNYKVTPNHHFWIAFVRCSDHVLHWFSHYRSWNSHVPLVLGILVPPITIFSPHLPSTCPYCTLLPPSRPCAQFQQKDGNLYHKSTETSSFWLMSCMQFGRPTMHLLALHSNFSFVVLPSFPESSWFHSLKPQLGHLYEVDK